MIWENYMAKDQQGSNKRVTSSHCSSPPFFSPSPFPSSPPLPPHSPPSEEDTQGLVAGSAINKRERLQLLLAKPVYTDGGKLHYFCEGRGRGREGGGLAEFTEVVYKLKEGGRQRTLGQDTSSMLHINKLSTTAARQPFRTFSTALFKKKFSSIQRLLQKYISILENSRCYKFVINHLKHKQILVGLRITVLTAKNERSKHFYPNLFSGMMICNEAADRLKLSHSICSFICISLILLKKKNI